AVLMGSSWVSGRRAGGARGPRRPAWGGSGDGGLHLSALLVLYHVGEPGQEPIQGRARGTEGRVPQLGGVEGGGVEEVGAVQAAALEQVVDPRHVAVRGTPLSHDGGQGGQFLVVGHGTASQVVVGPAADQEVVTAAGVELGGAQAGDQEVTAQ